MTIITTIPNNNKTIKPLTMTTITVITIKEYHHH
jgi:hypothetical protein